MANAIVTQAGVVREPRLSRRDRKRGAEVTDVLKSRGYRTVRFTYATHKGNVKMILPHEGYNEKFDEMPNDAEVFIVRQKGKDLLLTKGGIESRFPARQQALSL